MVKDLEEIITVLSEQLDKQLTRLDDLEEAVKVSPDMEWPSLSEVKHSQHGFITALRAVIEFLGEGDVSLFPSSQLWEDALDTVES